MTQTLDRPQTVTDPQTATDKCVARGAVYLDVHEPGWEYKINLFFLDIADSYTCIMGQLHGNYYRVYDVEGPDTDYEHAVAHGFAGYGPSREEAQRAITALNTEWRRVIRERRGISG